MNNRLKPFGISQGGDLDFDEIFDSKVENNCFRCINDTVDTLLAVS
jgi:hypothetical protein